MSKPSEIPYFIIEGNVGAGKSTLASLIKKHLDVQVVFEPYDQWLNMGSAAAGATESLLDSFYKDAARWAYTFYSYTFVTRVRAQQEHAKRHPYIPQIVERSVYSDRYCFAKNCFELGYMNALEWKLYQEWFSWLVDTCTHVPQGFIYLKTAPEVCHERLKKRVHAQETDVSLQYVQSLHDKHERWLINKVDVADSLIDVPVLTLNGDHDFGHDALLQQEMLKKIDQFIFEQYNQKFNAFVQIDVGL